MLIGFSFNCLLVCSLPTSRFPNKISFPLLFIPAFRFLDKNQANPSSKAGGIVKEFFLPSSFSASFLGGGGTVKQAKRNMRTRRVVRKLYNRLNGDWGGGETDGRRHIMVLITNYNYWAARVRSILPLSSFKYLPLGTTRSVFEIAAG